MLQGGVINFDTTGHARQLINTLFFKGGWIFPFDPAETRQENFYPVGGMKHPVSMILVGRYGIRKGKC